MKNYVDLNIYTAFLERKYKKNDLIEEAIKSGVKMLSVTDYNFIHSDMDELRKKYSDITLINGCNILSTLKLSTGREIQVSVVALDFDEEKLKPFVDDYPTGKEEYVNAIREKLKKELDIEVPDYSALKEMYPDYNVGKICIADYIFKNNYAKSAKDAFNKYLEYGKKAFVNSSQYCEFKDMETIINKIISANGIPVLTNLYEVFLFESEREEVVKVFKEYTQNNIAGIEIYYKGITDSEHSMLKGFADKYNLMYSVGTGFYSEDKTYSVDEGFIPVDEKNIYHYLKKRHS